jgi:two-component sensor histidine kinase
MVRPPTPGHDIVGAEPMHHTLVLAADTEDRISFRQLRHQTKNALQRVICEVARTATLQNTREGQRLLADLERRICLAAAISDALFGLTRQPDSLAMRLRALCHAMVELLGDADQVIRLQVSVDGVPPPDQAETVLRVAHEMVGNAIKHGMRARVLGRLVVTLHSSDGGTRLEVSDDGWGFETITGGGEGLRLMHELAAAHGGRVGLRRCGTLTVAELILPCRCCSAAI